MLGCLHAGLVGTAVSLTAIVSLAAAAAVRFSGTAFGLRPALAMPDAPLQAIPDALMGSKSPFNPRRALGRY